MIKTLEWTGEGVMRAPSFKGLRDDKPPREVELDGDAPEALFDQLEQLPEGSLAVVVEGRRLKLSNWDKVLFPRTGFSKGDMIA